MPQDLDLSQVQSSGFEPLPVGTYLCRVEVFDGDGRFSSNGNEMHEVRYRVVEPEQFQGRIIFDNLTITQNALPVVKGKLEAILGRKVTSVNWAETAAEALDRLVKVRVTIEQNEGYSARNKVQGLTPVNAIDGTAAPAASTSAKPTRGKPSLFQN